MNTNWNDVFGSITAVEVINSGAPTSQHELAQWLQEQYNDMYTEADRIEQDFENLAAQILREYENER